MFKNKLNILITGGEGFIGSHLIKLLSLNSKAKVISVDKKIGCNHQYLKKIIFVKSDIGNTSVILSLLKKYRVNVVIHLASLISVEESMRKPKSYFDNNFIKGFKLLESMKKCGVKKIIYSSSAAVYGLTSKKIISENCEKNPNNFYGLTKNLFEELLEYYSKVHNFNCINFRIFNVTGADPEGELKEYHRPETHLLPLVLRCMNFNRPVIIYGSDYNTPDGTCVRDYIHVNDVCRAILKAVPLLFQRKICESFNLGFGKGLSVLEVINTCGRIFKKNPKINWQEKRVGDPEILVADCGKIKRFLKWKPNYDLEKMIIHTFQSFYGKNNQFIP